MKYLRCPCDMGRCCSFCSIPFKPLVRVVALIGMCLSGVYISVGVYITREKLSVKETRLVQAQYTADPQLYQNTSIFPNMTVSEYTNVYNNNTTNDDTVEPLDPKKNLTRKLRTETIVYVGYGWIFISMCLILIHVVQFSADMTLLYSTFKVDVDSIFKIITILYVMGAVLWILTMACFILIFSCGRKEFPKKVLGSFFAIIAAGTAVRFYIETKIADFGGQLRKTGATDSDDEDEEAEAVAAISRAMLECDNDPITYEIREKAKKAGIVEGPKDLITKF